MFVRVPDGKCLAHANEKTVKMFVRVRLLVRTPDPPPASFGRPPFGVLEEWTRTNIRRHGAGQTSARNWRSNVCTGPLLDDVCTSPLLGFHVIPPRFCSLRAPRMFVRVDFGRMFVRVSLFGSARPARPKHPSGETTISGPFPWPFAEEPRAVSLLRMFVPRHFVAQKSLAAQTSGFGCLYG